MLLLSRISSASTVFVCASSAAEVGACIQIGPSRRRRAPARLRASAFRLGSRLPLARAAVTSLNTPADPADPSAASFPDAAASSSSDAAAPPLGDVRDGHEDLSAAVPILAQNPLLGSFGPDDWRAFTHYLERVTFPAATDVVREASEGQEMYFILAGIAHLRRAHIDLGTQYPRHLRVHPHGAHDGPLGGQTRLPP